MRLLTFVDPERPPHSPCAGVLLRDGQTVVDLQAASRRVDGVSREDFGDTLAFLEAGEPARAAAERIISRIEAESEGRDDASRSTLPADCTLPLADVRLLAPVRPRSIRDCMACERHLINVMRTVATWRYGAAAAGLDRCVERVLGRGFLRPPRVWYERPIYYRGNPASVVGQDADVQWPNFTRKLDYELEFGVFIGRTGRDIAAADARQYIAGYTIFNDFTARDVQLREIQGHLGPAKSKDFDTGNALGPVVVTPDEVPDPYGLAAVARINGELWSSGHTSEMGQRFEEMIAFISQSETLFPGDFIGSGTLPTGCGLELDRWIAPGDVVELEVERLGTLRNRVVRHVTSDRMAE